MGTQSYDRAQAGKSVPNPLRRFLPALVLGSAILAGSQAVLASQEGELPKASATHETRFTVTYGGLTVGNMTFAVSLDGKSYELRGNGRTRGLAEWFAPGKADIRSSGRLSGQVLASDNHYLSVTESGKTATLRIAYSPQGEPEVFLQPDKRKKNPDPAKYVLLEPDHLRDVVDPASTLVVPVERERAKDPLAVCNRTLRVYDGETRFDIRLSYKENRQVRTAGYDGWAYVCRLDYVPVAGHRRNHRPIERMASNRDMEMWLAPVSTSAGDTESDLAVFTAIRIHVPTWVGTFTAEPDYFGPVTQ